MSQYLDRAKVLRAIIEPHYNCGQSVILPFAETLGFDEATVMRFAANYGRGMKGHALCGAIAGGATVLGLYGIDDLENLGDYYARIRKICPKGIDCAVLLYHNAEAGNAERKPHCDALVYEVIQVVEDMLREKGLISQ